MTLNLPTDGFGVYESVITLSNSATYQPRLDQIAAGGFKLVLNYSLISGHATDMIAYINYAATKGLKVIVPLDDPAIWRDGTYSTSYPQMYADASNPGTGIAFMQYVVAQSKSLAGTWGWYVCDEVFNTDHATFKTYCDAVATADNTHPRLAVESATNGNYTFYLNNSTQYDCAEVIADDYYPLNYTAANNAGLTEAFTGSIASGIQTTATARSKSSGIVLQAFSFSQVALAVCTPYPSCATFPAYVNMATVLNLALANMTPRLVLFWSYAYIQTSDNPTQHWNDLVAVIANINKPKFGLLGH